MFEFEGSRSEFLKILAEMGEEPAFVARARAPAERLEQLLVACEIRRAELLKWPRRHFTLLRFRVAGDWHRIYQLVTDDDASSIFERLRCQLPELAPHGCMLFASDRAILKNFLDSARRFNRQWMRFLDGAGLEAVNRLRDEYNRLYPIEKAAAFGTDRVNDGFFPLPMLDRDYLLHHFPLLHLPSLR